MIDPRSVCSFAALASGVLGVLLCCGNVGAQAQSRPSSRPPRDDRAAESLGWKLGTQAWTWNFRTAFDTVAIASALGLKYIEFYPGQKLSAQHGDVKMGPGMGEAAIADLEAHLKAHHMTAVSFGVVSPKNDEAEARALFTFAKRLGLRTITAEPSKDAFDLVEKLCTEFQIAVALHDHPKPSPYWSPELVLEAVGSRSKLLGACADTGHWVRSGLVPVECLKKLEGRVITLHFKDIDKKDKLDKPWGTGEGDARGMLLELARQGFTGVFSLEYEHGRGEALERDAAACIAFFDQVAAEIVAQKKASEKR